MFELQNDSPVHTRRIYWFCSKYINTSNFCFVLIIFFKIYSNFTELAKLFSLKVLRFMRRELKGFIFNSDECVK